jgi:2-polyprenyl-6-hydroxyphenyl methylase/3-demethylubiquinone-9 3-methyltransferase
MKTVECKICGGTSRLFTSVDFSQHCNKQYDHHVPLSGLAVDYYRCSLCEFIFTDFIDDYEKEDLIKNIYNEDYIKFDPLYPKIRPEINARFLESIVSDPDFSGGSPGILDYGAGNGMLSRLLEDKMIVRNYDLLNAAFDRLPLGEQFDLIFCAEVIEHMPFPHRFMKDWASLLSDRGFVLFSTEIQPPDIEAQKGSWWYLGPRNGHVSIFSRKSLRTLCAQHAMLYESLNDTWHLAFRTADTARHVARLKAKVALLPTGFILV